MAAIDKLFKEIKKSGASDLHLFVGLPPILRLKGEMVRTDEPILTKESNKELIYEILNDEQIGELEKTKIETRIYTDYEERYALFLWPAFGLILLEILLASTLLRRFP